MNQCSSSSFQAQLRALGSSLRWEVNSSILIVTSNVTHPFKPTDLNCAVEQKEQALQAECGGC